MLKLKLLLGSAAALLVASYAAVAQTPAAPFASMSRSEPAGTPRFGPAARSASSRCGYVGGEEEQKCLREEQAERDEARRHGSGASKGAATARAQSHAQK